MLGAEGDSPLSDGRVEALPGAATALAATAGAAAAGAAAAGVVVGQVLLLVLLDGGGAIC